jgi:hypothetical protein
VGDNIDTIKKNTQTLIDASKEVGLEVNAEKSKYILLSRHQNAGQNSKINNACRFFENVAQLKYLGTRVTNQNLFQEGIKRRYLLSCRLPSNNVRIRVYKTIILTVILYGCKTWSLISREGHRLRVFQNDVLRRIFERKRDEVIRSYRKLHSDDLHNLYSSANKTRTIKSLTMKWEGHVAGMGRRGTHIGYWWEIQKERYH